MPPAANKTRAGPLRAWPDIGWRFACWTSAAIEAGITDRLTQRPAMIAQLKAAHIAEGEQVHGAAIALVDHPHDGAGLIAGCDALMTQTPGVALLVRTADCLPVFFAHAARPAVALAHTGWRGLAMRLPARVLAAFWDVYRCPAEEVEVAIGPAIRACCYAVGAEFSGIFGSFVAVRGGKRTCDLIGVVRRQLKEAGVARAKITDSGVCTACGTDRWYSLRREGPSTGRLTSFIMIKQ